MKHYPGVPIVTTEAITVRTESELVRRLDHLATSWDKSLNDMVNQALQEFLEHHARHVEKINQGLAAADRGELIGHDDLMSELEGLIDGWAKSKP